MEKVESTGKKEQAISHVPKMFFISTNIDISQGMLFLESPHCKERLQIKLDSNMDIGSREDVGLYGQRHSLESFLLFCFLPLRMLCPDYLKANGL
ncbi:hypothetical protein K1719_033390 [Acacia pycnantha]|nr:hypothetical protein K1719_033390 [Acacia pycnantha]